MIAAKAALDKHAERVVVIDLRRLSSVTDFFVIATATSLRQLRAITEQIEQKLAHRGMRVWHVEGIGSTDSGRSRQTWAEDRPQAISAEPPSQESGGLSWVLMDCGDFVIHLFSPLARNFYQLERLWADAPRIPLDPLLPKAKPA